MHTLPLCSQTLFESIILGIMMSVTLFEETLLVLFSMSTTISSGTYMQSKTKLVQGWLLTDTGETNHDRLCKIALHRFTSTQTAAAPMSIICLKPPPEKSTRDAVYIDAFNSTPKCGNAAPN